MTPVEIVSKMSESIHMSSVWLIGKDISQIKSDPASKLSNDKHICVVLFGREIAQRVGVDYEENFHVRSTHSIIIYLVPTM